MKLTFDLNCIIAIENFEINHIYLQQLLDFHDNYRLTITIPAMSAKAMKMLFVNMIKMIKMKLNSKKH